MSHPTSPKVPLAGWLSLGAALTLLTGHFTMTFLHVTPLNPVKVEYERAVSAWTEPLFDQNWKLFAPNPMAVDQGVLVRARLKDGSQTDFTDIVTPYLEDKHHNLLPSRAGYQVSGVLTRFLEARESLVTSLSDAERDAAPLFLTDEHLDVADADERYTYAESLADLWQSSLFHLGISEEQVDALQIRIVQHTFPRFSERADAGLGEITHSSSPWIRHEGTLS